MERLEFYDFEDFADDIYEAYENLRDLDDAISVIAKYDEMKYIISELVRLGYDLTSVDLRTPEGSGYNSEYIISLDKDGIWCEPMLRSNGYLYNKSPITYILDNCSSKVIEYCEGKIVYEVYVEESGEEYENSDDDFDDEDNGGFNRNYCGCDYCKSNSKADDVKSRESDNKLDKRDFSLPDDKTSVNESYKINGKEVDKETYDKEFSKLEKSYDEFFKRQLVNYTEFMDEMSEFRKLFGWRF